MGGDLLAFSVKAADEANFVQNVFGRVADEIKDPVLLPYSRG
jgi:hypothetical protein